MTKIKASITETETRLQNHDTFIKNLETRIGQIADFLITIVQGSFPSNTEVNPKEYKAINIISGEEIKVCIMRV